MKFTLRPYQEATVSHAVKWFDSASAGDHRLYASPTGTGKSVIELALLERMPDAVLLTPKLEIVAGMLDKLGVTPDDREDRLAEQGQSHRIYTPMRLRGLMLSGRMPAPKRLVIDEAHHDLARTWQDVHALTGYAPCVGFTASAFRGTPKGTAEFRRLWGDPVHVMTFREAQRAGHLSMPACTMLPLVDDDVIEIANGELVASQVNDATRSRLADLVEHCGRYVTGPTWHESTMFAVPSSEIARDLTERLNAAGMPSAFILQDTPQRDRQRIFSDAVARRLALVQVYVVSEGVDLPIRRLIDLSPTLSPVKWVQQFGRITRPGGVSEYVCTNRNLFRHAYTLDGGVKTAELLAAQTAFEKPSARSSARVIGLEALGRLKATGVPLRGGLLATAYCVSAIRGDSVVDYCAIAHPNREEVYWAERESERVPGSTRAWGKWRKCEAPDSLEGYTSVAPSPLSEKQAELWKRTAGKYGLDPTAEVNARVFQVLAVMWETGGRM